MIFKPVQIENYLKKPDMNIKAILMYGPNEGLQLDTIKRLAKSTVGDINDAFLVTELNASAVVADIGILYGEFNGQSLLGGRRVIILNDAGDSLTKPLRKMLDESGKSENLLLINSDGLTKKSSLVKLAEDSPDMAGFGCYDDKNEDIMQIIKSMRMTFDAEALALLCSKLCSDRMINRAELEKLAVYMGNAKHVSLKDIKAVISDTADSDMGDICYAVAEGDKTKAINLYEKYLNEGNDAVSAVKALSYHFMKLLACQAGIEDGETMDKAINSRVYPKLIFYQTDSFKRQLGWWGKEKLLRALDILYTAEKDCKTTGMPANEIVSMAILKLSGAAKR